MVRFLAIAVVLLVVLVRGPLPSLPTSGAFAQDTTSLEQRVSKIEDDVRSLDRYTGFGGVSFLFGAFCALWAQNTRRRAWLWFFLGLFFSVITVIVLLVKNSGDRERHEASAGTA